jgi:hypothetical protein
MSGAFAKSSASPGSATAENQADDRIAALHGASERVCRIGEFQCRANVSPSSSTAALSESRFAYRAVSCSFRRATISTRSMAAFLPEQRRLNERCEKPLDPSLEIAARRASGFEPFSLPQNSKSNLEEHDDERK